MFCSFCLGLLEYRGSLAFVCISSLICAYDVQKVSGKNLDEQRKSLNIGHLQKHVVKRCLYLPYLSLPAWKTGRVFFKETFVSDYILLSLSFLQCLKDEKEIIDNSQILIHPWRFTALCSNRAAWQWELSYWVPIKCSFLAQGRATTAAKCVPFPSDYTSAELAAVPSGTSQWH